MNKELKYRRIISQFGDLCQKTNDIDARMTTMAALLHHKLSQVLWTGFYVLKNGELLVKTYQGPLACQVLKKNTGVCWTGINTEKTIVVPDVHQFNGHIACDPRSKSEIVVPVRDKKGKITGVLDIDSKVLNGFDETDAFFLEELIAMIYK